MIRGKNVGEALAVLQHTNKRAAGGIEKCVRSAIANATELAEKANVAVDPDDLWVKACFVDIGPTKNRRRMRPAPQGRAYREQRHFCHVTVLVSSEDKEAVKGSPKDTAGKKTKGALADKESGGASAKKGRTRGATKATKATAAKASGKARAAGATKKKTSGASKKSGAAAETETAQE
jgi:large subunit ribosomal protein L22